MTVSEIGHYPTDWKIDRIDSVFDIQQGKQVSKKNRVGDNQRPFLRTKNIFWNRLDIAELDQMNFTEAEIVTQAEALEAKLMTHRRKHESLQDLFRTLLHELMTAKIRVDGMS